MVFKVCRFWFVLLCATFDLHLVSPAFAVPIIFPLLGLSSIFQDNVAAPVGKTGGVVITSLDASKRGAIGE